MKNVRQICKEISQYAYTMIDSAIQFGAVSVEFEKRYGSASVIVEIGYRNRHGWQVPFTDVVVLHDDCCHTSPLLTAAIEKALPVWSDIEKAQQAQMQYSL